MILRAAPLLALLAGCSYITDDFATNGFSGDPFPFHVDTTSGAILIGMQPDGDSPHTAVLDVLSPVTIIDHGTDAKPTIATPDIELLGCAPGDPCTSTDSLAIPRARLSEPQLLTLHPCSDPTCQVGADGAAQPFDALVGMDAFASDALRMDLDAGQMFILKDIAGSEVDRTYACDAVLPTAFRGGGTLLVGGTELQFGSWRPVVAACATPDPDPDVVQSARGVDMLFVMSTSIGPSLLSASAYARFTQFDPSAPPYDPTATTTVYLPSGPVQGFATTLPSLALVANSSAAPRAPCRQVFASHLLVTQNCADANDADGCPCFDTTGQTHYTYCPAPAIVELHPPAALPVLVVDDADPTLQSLRAELRPNEPEVDGILGTSALAGVELDFDYPHDRLLARCTDAGTCAVRPELEADNGQPHNDERTQVQGCLGVTP